MIKLEKTDVYGWEAAIRGMRNPMNSWHFFCQWIKELPYSEIITGRRLKVLKVEGEN